MTIVENIASISQSAGKEGLTEAYGHFKEDAAEIDSQYKVASVNTDGWSATVCAWKSLYSDVKPVRCFLHGFIKIRSCAKKHPLFYQISQKVWEVYRQQDKESFLSSVCQLQEWANQNLSGSALDSVLKLCKRADEYALAYDHPTAYRTSNMIDRHMDPMDRYLASSRYFHGHLQSAEDGIRAWALMHNFLPYCPRSKASEQHMSPAHKLNQFVYHDNWLENLLVSASMGGIPA